jgi:lipopolysaccharide export system protein LptA
MKHALPLLALLLGPASIAAPVPQSGPDLSQGGPVTITALDGVDWQQDQQIVVARGDAHATRGTTTVIADTLTAHYRKKPATGATPAPAAAKADDSPTGSNEIYRLDADGHVTINTPTDIAFGDKAVYDIDQAVLIMTGKNLRLKTPTETITARDRLEYWSMLRLSVARGDALVVGNDGRSVQADILAAYSDPSAPQTAAAKPTDSDINAGQLRRVDAFGHVVVRTQADIVRGDKGVYLPQTGLARVVGDVTITHGLSELHGQDAIIDLKTGIAHLQPGTGERVQGLLVPNDHSTDQTAPAGAPPKEAKPK